MTYLGNLQLLLLLEFGTVLSDSSFYFLLDLTKDFLLVLECLVDEGIDLLLSH